MIVETNNLVIPEHLDEKFYIDALENGLREMCINVTKVVYEAGNQAGENYCSNIYRVQVQFHRNNDEEIETIALIVKCITITEATAFLQELGVFSKEKLFYIDILPRLEILLNDGKLGANCFMAVKEPIQTLVFNDLTSMEYELANRQQGLDEEHCKVVLKKLGQFHATSMILLKKDPGFTKNFQTGMLGPNNVRNDQFTHICSSQLNALINIVSQWPDYENITEKLNAYRENFVEHLINAATPCPDELKVLNHGDLWINNFMYKYSDETERRPIDALLIDFQCSFVGSPGCDLNFFLSSSVQLDVLISKRDVLIDTYYDSLRSCLEELHFDSIPALDDILYELQQREGYGFFAAFSFLPMVAMLKEDAVENAIEQFNDDDFCRKQAEIMFYSNERTLSTLGYLLKRLEAIGFFNQF